MKHLLRLGFVAMAIPALAAAASPAPSGKFITPDKVLSFWTPSPPRKTVNEFKSKAGLPVRQTTFAIEGPQYLILVAVLELSGPPATGDEASMLDPMIDDMRKGFGPGFSPDLGQGLTGVSLEQQGLHGKQVTATVDGSIRVKLRVFLGACRVYSFQVAHSVGDARTADIGEQLLKSVSIQDPGETQTCELKPAAAPGR